VGSDSTQQKEEGLMAPFKDRLIFDKRVLPNGLTIYHKPMDVPFASMRVVLPVGHAHNTGEIPHGTAHFLEHMVCRKCRAFPELKAFNRHIELDGGNASAATGNWETLYTVMVPAPLFAKGFRALISRVFEPIFDEEGLGQERKVISSERRMQSKWHPGESEISHYIDTQWRDLGFTGLRQDVGDDCDLAQMTVPILRGVHKAYFSPDTYVIAGGACDIDLMERELSTVKTHPVVLPFFVPPYRWVKQGYHERGFEDERRFTYRIAGQFPGASVKAFVAMRCLQSLLIHPVQGALHSWLRDELGWSYEVRFNYEPTSPGELGEWVLSMPVNDRQQAAIVRRELRGRIESALNDKRLISSEIRRLVLSSVFDMQTLSGVLRYGGSMIKHFGRVPNESELQEILQSLEDGQYLRDLYETWWAPEVTGEFLSTPLAN
jgi:predicted Zn-dependent peptidase